MRKADPWLLAADVGGTSTRWALLPTGGGVPFRTATLPSASFSTFGEALAQFLGSPPPPLAAACVAVAGPVHAGRARLTNLPWEVEAVALAAQLALPPERVRLLNDVEAIAWAIPTLPPEALAWVQRGTASTGNAALIAVGTGLGEAGMYWGGRRHLPFASEGGHADFAPRDEVEWEFTCELRRRWGHVSWERVLSGAGLVALYEFLAQRQEAEIPLQVRQRMEEADPAAAVAEAAQLGLCPRAGEAVDRFLGLLGAEAGNLALKLLARGGVYLGGGIPPKLLAGQRVGVFLAGFLDKGRMRPLLEEFPVAVILDENAGLRGAGVLAALLARGELTAGA